MTSQHRTSLAAPLVIISVRAQSIKTTTSQLECWSGPPAHLAKPRFKILKKQLELRSGENVRVYRGPGLGVLVRSGRDPHCRPHCVDPGQVDVEAEEDVGEGGEETDGPVTEIVE